MPQPIIKKRLPYEYHSIKLCGEYTNLEKLNGHKIFEVPSLPIRVRILQELIKAYLNRLTISRLRARMGNVPGHRYENTYCPSC